MKKGNLYVVSAPSGAGKGTVLNRLLQLDSSIALSISATTRAPRDGEINGVSYYFLSKAEFEAKIENDALLEYAEYAGNYYGTPIDYITEKTNQGIDIILEIEVVGASLVKAKCPEATLVFITPPSYEELEKRLVNRGTEDMETIKKRLEIAKIEMNEKDKFDYIVVNDKVDETSNNILNIIKKGRV